MIPDVQPQLSLLHHLQMVLSLMKLQALLTQLRHPSPDAALASSTPSGLSTPGGMRFPEPRFIYATLDSKTCHGFPFPEEEGPVP